jgi:VWFA-related protein
MLGHQNREGAYAAAAMGGAAGQRPTNGVGMARKIATFAVCTMVVRAAAIAQQPPHASVTFTSETRAIQINVSVKDAQGYPVHGLRKEDFAVTDNGKAREIQLFSPDEEGSPAPDTPGPPKGVFSNRFGPPAAQERITALVIDARPHLTAQVGSGGAPLGGRVTNSPVLVSHTNQALARENAMRAVEQMHPGEKLAVYAICPDLRILHDYTTDRAGILASLKAFVPVAYMPSAWGRDPYSKEFSALRAVAEHMSAAPGRKSVVWISPAFADLGRMERAFPGILMRYHATVQAFNEANVALYVVDVGGVSGLGEDGPGMTFASETGGRSVYQGNSLDQAIAEAVDETQYTYELGFYLSAADFDGKFHQLAVKVPGQPKLSLEYRRGYSASASPPAAERKPTLDAELLNPADSSGVGIDATLKALPGPDGNELQVSLALDDATLGIGKDGAAAVDETFVETGANGALLGKVEESLQFHPPPAEQTARYARTIKLPKGAVLLKIVVRDKATGHIGSLSIPLAGLGP